MDLIDREAMMNYIRSRKINIGKLAHDIIMKQPSIQPQEPCDDAISRDAVQDYIAKYLSQYMYNDVREAVEVIDEYIGELPSVKPQEKTGRWKRIGYDIYECSICGQDVMTGDICAYKHCHGCGAKMKVGD